MHSLQNQSAYFPQKLSTVDYLIFDNWIGVKWYLFAVLGISLIINEVGHLFMCL